jgi:hypothetical protein
VKVHEIQKKEKAEIAFSDSLHTRRLDDLQMKKQCSAWKKNERKQKERAADSAIRLEKET